MADQEGTCVVQLLLPNALSSAIWTSFLNTFFFFHHDHHYLPDFKAFFEFSDLSLGVF